jgi:hypothetical protein
MVDRSVTLKSRGKVKGKVRIPPCRLAQLSSGGIEPAAFSFFAQERVAAGCQEAR